MRALISLFVLSLALSGADAPGLRSSIESHLRKPYVWGSTGLKSFDCSGFVWRVLADNGIFIKRTTARKLAMSLPVADGPNRFAFGTLVLFDSYKHCGIVNSKDSFYHAQCSRGTNLSAFQPFWGPKVCGFRKLV